MMSSALPAAWMSDIIKQKKALNMHHYMHYCLFDKTYGYYMNKQVFGREGDFITAADISQLFGETIAIWAIDKWKKMGYPKHFNLIELGPGRATMMVDFLNIAKHWPEFIKACQFYFVEISPALQNLQQKRLQPILKKLCCQAVWVDDIDRVEMGTNLVIANEFFDALPIRQFCFNQGQWFERLVSLEQDQTLRFICADEPTLINDQTGDLKACDGDIFEIGTVAHQIAKKLAERAQKAQTHGLIIDYGYLKTAFGDSLQGLKNHRYHDIFLDQGAVDLTAHVNFSDLIKIFKKHHVKIEYCCTQGEFLMSYAIDARAKKLLESCADNKLDYKKRAQIKFALHRLIAPNQMGQLFKVLHYYTDHEMIRDREHSINHMEIID